MQSKSGKLNKADYKKLGWNFVKFVAPTLAILFYQLSKGVDFKIAGLLALFALYQSLSDFFSKLNAGK